MLHARICIDADADARREPRLDIMADIPLRPLGAGGVEGRLLNISSHGFMVATDAPIEAGSRVWLTLPGMARVNALVHWARNGRIGGEFSSPLDPLAVIQAIGRSRT
jgi:hypothetical protein